MRAPVRCSQRARLLSSTCIGSSSCSYCFFVSLLTTVLPDCAIAQVFSSKPADDGIDRALTVLQPAAAHRDRASARGVCPETTRRAPLTEIVRSAGDDVQNRYGFGIVIVANAACIRAGNRIQWRTPWLRGWVWPAL